MSILKWLGLADDDDAGQVDSLRDIEAALSGLEPARARYLAAVAYVLSRVAGADHVITDEESASMQRILAEKGGLDQEQAALAVRIAKTQALRHRGTEDYIVTRELASLATREQKLALLDCLFTVSSSDRSILTVEDNEIRRIASELKLEHADFIRIRSSHTHHLEVLRDRKSGE